MKSLTPALIVAALAGTASAQCNVYRYGVPDFDQRRSYLPDDGAVHCVPTSLLNWMGYIANHGQPQALAHSSPDWSSMSEYDLVNVRLYNMGGWMDTGTPNGTTTADGVHGLVDYMDYYNVGPAIVMGRIADEDWQVTPKKMYSYMNLGFMVSFCFGRYTLDGDEWERNGGHCLTVCGLNDACDSNNARIGFKDPNTKTSTDPIDTQSTFKTKWWDVSRQTRNYDGDVFPQWGPAGQASGPGDTIRIIDTVFVIMPLFVLTQDLNGGGLALHLTGLTNNDDQAPTQIVSIPGGAPLLHAATDPRSINSILVTGPAGGAPARVWDYDRAEQSFTSILDLPASPGAFTIDRRADILLEINGDLHKYRYAADGSVRLLSTVKVGLAMQSIAVDDATDDVYALAAGPRRLLKFPGGDLTAAPYEGPLPAAMPVGIVPCIAPNPADGKVWFCSEASSLIYQLTPGAAAPGWTITGSVQTGAGMQPTALQFGDRGEMKFISGDRIREWEIDPASGRYIPSGDPHFQDLPASRFLSLARSRSNFDPRVHVGPAWAPLDDPDPDTAEVPDCPADFNGDGFVDGIDYDEFNNLFEAGNINSDVNFDGFVDGIDYDTFNNWFEKGC